MINLTLSHWRNVLLLLPFNKLTLRTYHLQLNVSHIYKSGPEYLAHFPYLLMQMKSLYFVSRAAVNALPRGFRLRPPQKHANNS
jgi:hypothetical protein